MNIDFNDPNVMAFVPEFSQVAEYKAEEYAKMPVNEGIDVTYRKSDDDPGANVIYNPTHNYGIDSTLAHNPTVTDIHIPGLYLDNDVMKVYSTLKRTDADIDHVGPDGNPLLYAFKGERGYKFAPKGDRKCIKRDVKAILDKFVKQYFSTIKDDVATVIIPSGNSLNDMFAEWFEDCVTRNGYKMKVYDEVLEKVTTDTIRNEVLDDSRSEFYKWIYSMPKQDRVRMKHILLNCLDNMDKTHNGTFSYHLVNNKELRNHLSLSMKMSHTPSVARECKDINNCNLILLDDSISRGTSLKEAYSLLVQCYYPNTAIGLTMFSSLNPGKSK